MAYDDYQLIRIARGRHLPGDIDHPPINLLDLHLIGEIGRLTQEVGDDEVRVLIVDSADPEFFIAHADVELIPGLPTDDTSLHDELSAVPCRDGSVPDPAARPPSPSSRASPAAAAANWRWPSTCAMPRSARRVFGQPEVAVGIIPGGGGTQRLPRLVGRGRALEVILGCMDIDAATAETWGYVDRALPADELRPFVDNLAARIASHPLEAISRAKRAVDAALDGRADLATGLRIEDQLFREALAQPVARERLQAILDAGAQTREFELGEISPT